MIATIKIEPQMSCEYICKRVHDAILKYQGDNPDLSNSIIIIDIRKPVDDTNIIPKLEFNLNS